VSRVPHIGTQGLGHTLCARLGAPFGGFLSFMDPLGYVSPKWLSFVSEYQENQRPIRW
jgi:hypothetical protein